MLSQDMVEHLKTWAAEFHAAVPSPNNLAEQYYRGIMDALTMVLASDETLPEAIKKIRRRWIE